MILLFDNAEACEKLSRRFWAKVDRSGGPDACWPWMASARGKDYGAFWLDGRNVIAHRMAWALSVGPLGDGECVLHRCDNPRCCNVGHLFLGSVADNNLDMRVKGRHGTAKLSPGDVLDVLASLASGEQRASIARRLGVDPATVSKAANGETHMHVRAHITAELAAREGNK